MFRKNGEYSQYPQSFLACIFLINAKTTTLLQQQSAGANKNTRSKLQKEAVTHAMTLKTATAQEHAEHLYCMLQGPDEEFSND